MDSAGQLAKKSKPVSGGAAGGSVGEVRFETADAAQRALALDGSSCGGGTISVVIDEKSKDGTKIVVKQIPRSCEWQELKDHFASCGTVAFADIKANNGPMMGEIRFETADEAKQAISVLSGTELMGSTITVKNHPTSKDGTKLQVMGVPPECQWQELKDAFSEVGNVVFADVVQGQKLPPGMKIEGEVRYDDPAHAHTAMTSLNGSFLGGGQIFIELDPKSSDGAKIIVNGLLPGVGWQELKDHFSPVGSVAFAQIHTKGGFAKGMGKGFDPRLGAMGGFPGFGSFAGFGGKGGRSAPVKKVPGSLMGEVRYDFPMHAHMAVSMLNGSVLKGGQIQVDWDWKSSDGTKLWVAGIPPQAGWQDLKDHFASVGQVAFADIKKK